MRDHKKLRAFELADTLALSVYKVTKLFPKDEQFGLTSQMRRAAVSVASNIVEGCARATHADYVRFLDIAYASACELGYQLTIAARLGYVPVEMVSQIAPQANETTRVLAGLLTSLRQRPSS